MVLINGSKYACEACFRGHRTSSCAHTTRQLHPVRPKGRPSSQCEQCRARRAAGSFHGRCECMLGSDGDDSPCESSRSASQERKRAKREVRRASQASPDVYTESRFTMQPLATAPSRGKHSLASLMNPCRCRTTAICTCCKSSRPEEASEAIGILQQYRGNAQSREECQCASEACCGDDMLACAQKTMQDGECCGSAKQENVTKITPSTDECQCGVNCSCPGCRARDRDSLDTMAAQGIDDCPERCTTCTGCAYGLTRPSGIEAVDEWMRKDCRAGEARKIEGQGSKPHVQLRPPLPPFERAQDFYDTHFVNPERRAWFAEQRQPCIDQKETGANPLPRKDAAFGDRLAGETDAEWQARHGFAHLTPDAIAIFDRSRAFREERARQEAALESV